MQKQIEMLVSDTVKGIDVAQSERELNELKVKVLGKSGELTSFLRKLKEYPEEDRPLVGKYVNDARLIISAEFDKKSIVLHKKELEQKVANEKIDITLDKAPQNIGSLHPLNIIRNKIEEYFVSMGFVVEDSPEIETDYYNFEALNIPDDHPARELQDTFFITDNILLRSQTSCGQIRTMEKSQPPIKMLSPGRVYRCDDIDATHSPMFHQIEGLVVDKGITMCDLKGTLEGFAKKFFGAETKIRFRPSYFPFTEPSVEVDATCNRCKGAGCSVCKGTGWIEVLGAGMVNRHVLENCKIDPDVYTGFAFGIGLDRITNIIYSITDLRTVFENDIRFLKQFNEIKE